MDEIEYQRKHTAVPIESANKPANYVPPVDITTIDPLANVPADTGITFADKVAMAKSEAERLIGALPFSQQGVVRDIAAYIEPVMKREMSPEDVACAVKVERTTVWRWLKRIDPALIKTRRPSVNVDKIDAATALAIFRDFAYNKIKRVQLAEKYNLPDKAIIALIERGREVNSKTLAQHHKHTKDAAG